MKVYMFNQTTTAQQDADSVFHLSPMKALKSSKAFKKKYKSSELSRRTFVPLISVKFPSPEEIREIEESEEARMMKQARLGRSLKTSTARRLLAWAQSSTTDSFDGNSGTRKRRGIRKRQIKEGPVELQKHEEHRVMRLTDVTILPKAEHTFLGTLEAHVNGFVYTDPSWHMVFMHENIDKYFMRLGDTMMPPFLQFHLKHPIMVGTKETKDIQFFLAPPLCGEDNCNDDLNSSRNEYLKNFVHKVEHPEWRICGSRLPIYFEEISELEFPGACPTSASSRRFALTFSSLVMLEVETPLAVVLLRDFEIVNLAQGRPEEFDMIVVLDDFNRDVLEINHIPKMFLTRVQGLLNDRGVKYYVSTERPNWNMVLKDIRESPEKFIDAGGWLSLGLEDSRTLSYYTAANSDSDSDSDLQRKYSLQW